MPMQEEALRNPPLQPAPSHDFGADDVIAKANGATPTAKVSDPAGIRPEIPQPPPKPQIPSSTPPSAATSLRRGSTLSWQQRPSSRGSTGLAARPISMLASDKIVSKPPRQTTEPVVANEDALSRSQIAQSLGSRDPSWFKQTQERGVGSAALRKKQVEDAADTASTTSSLRLPGMSRESTAEPESRMSPPPESVWSSAPSQEGSSRGSLDVNPQISSATSESSRNGIQPWQPTKPSQRFEPPSSDTISTSGDDASSNSRSLAMSPSQGRISPERVDRPASPTKGVGGFVQSAMLKRSDSVNKRWSAQAGPGLSRGNSTASNLSGYSCSRYPLGGITPLTESMLNSVSREGSPTSTSRPTSSHSTIAAPQRLSENDRPDTSISVAGNMSGPARSDEKPGMQTNQECNSLQEVMSPPASPSKRWSPTKSSWLENAINKPDSPSIKSPAPQQPAWMAEINRAKQKRGSVDIGKGSNFKEVAIGGLVRSPPPGATYKPPSISGLPSGFSAGVATKSRNGSEDDVAQKVTPLATTRPEDPDQKTVPKETFQSKKSKAMEMPNNIPDDSTTTKTTVSPKVKPADRSTERRPTSSPSTKVKPETPPKKDFKSTLKPRQTSGEHKPKVEPEFKNVFGNLKRTQTKNYVAPNELKDNIMRGKAGLAQTGGPKKTERKDEFKESILQKKQGMVVPSASTRITSASSNIQDQSLPEAIARRRGLTRSESAQNNGIAEGDKPAPKPEALAKVQHLRDKSQSPAPEQRLDVSTSLRTDSGLDSNSNGGFTASLAGMLQRGPSPMAVKHTAASSSKSKPDVKDTANTNEPDVPSGGAPLTHATKARARGPKRRLPTTSTQDTSASTERAGQDPQSQSLMIETNASLTTNAPADESPSLGTSQLQPKPLSNIIQSGISNRKPSQPLSPRKPSTTIASVPNPKPSLPRIQATTQEKKAVSSPPLKQKPALSLEADDLHQSSAPTPIAFRDSPLTRNYLQDHQSKAAESVREGEAREADPLGVDAPLPSVKGAAAVWGQSSKPTQPSRARSPVKLPTRKDEEAALEEAGLRLKESISSSINGGSEELQFSTNGNLLRQSAQLPKSPPLPGKKPSSLGDRIASTTLPPSIPTSNQPAYNPASQPSDANGLFANILDESPNLKLKLSLNTQSVLDSCSSNDNSPKIKTLRKQIFVIAENGKSIPVPSQQEHILFDECLYVCSHVFGNHAGQRTTEVYLWRGDATTSSAVEDAQLFAKKFAKDNSARLVTIRQGKETTNFFQALGGIVITRRGSSSKSENPAGSGAPYLLCGRQHVGQIAFDEVDCNPQSLCKGFPCIVAAQGGKLYLWKGRGSGADELGCARLIGMDLGLTGEIEEIDDGREPDAFWRAFPGIRKDRANQQAASGQHWHLKPSFDNYRTRLFNVTFEAQRPKSASGFIQGAMQWGRRGSAPANDPETARTPQIKDISPFAQSDLVDDGVFVLDAFFEIFV